MFDEISYIMGQKAGGGGGNPNYSKTFTGNLGTAMALALNSMTTQEKVAIIGLNEGNASAIVSINTSALGIERVYTFSVSLLEANLRADLVDMNGNGITNAVVVVWDTANPGDVKTAYAYMGGNIVNLMQYAAALPTTVTFYFHNMPTGG